MQSGRAKLKMGEDGPEDSPGLLYIRIMKWLERRNHKMKSEESQLEFCFVLFLLLIVQW